MHSRSTRRHRRAGVLPRRRADVTREPTTPMGVRCRRRRVCQRSGVALRRRSSRPRRSGVRAMTSAPPATSRAAPCRRPRCPGRPARPQTGVRWSKSPSSTRSRSDAPMAPCRISSDLHVDPRPVTSVAGPCQVHTRRCPQPRPPTARARSRARVCNGGRSLRSHPAGRAALFTSRRRWTNCASPVLPGAPA